MPILCPKCNTEHVPTDNGSDTIIHGMQCVHCGHVWENQPTGSGKLRQGARRIVLKPDTDTGNYPDRKNISDRALMEKAQRMVAGAAENTANHISTAHADDKMKEDGIMDTILSSKEAHMPDRDEPTGKPKKRLPIWQNIAAGVVAFTIFAGGLMMWQKIISVAPAMQTLYSLVGTAPNPRGLEFASVKTKARPGSDGAILVVEGLIKNVTTSAVELPAVHVAMRAADGQEISSWLYQPDKQSLEAGETFEFLTEMNNPPQNARDIKLKFTNRSQQDGSVN